MNTARETRRAVIVMVVLVAIWGYSWISSKIGLAYASPLDFAAIRIELGLAALFAAMLWTRTQFAAREWGALVLIGLVQTCGFTLLNTWALSLGEPGKTSILVFTMPFWVLLFAWPFLHERIRGLQWAAVALSAGGLVLLLEPWAIHTSLLGKMLAVCGGMCWAISVVVAKRLHSRRKVNELSFTFWQVAIGLIPILIAQTLYDRQAIHWTMPFVFAALFNGVVATGIGWLAWLYVLHRLPAGTTSLSSLGIPLIAIGASWLQFGEQPGLAELVGMLLIGLALALLSYLSIRTHEEPEVMTGQE